MKMLTIKKLGVKGDGGGIIQGTKLHDYQNIVKTSSTFPPFTTPKLATPISDPELATVREMYLQQKIVILVGFLCVSSVDGLQYAAQPVFLNGLEWERYEM